MTYNEDRAAHRRMLKPLAKHLFDAGSKSERQRLLREGNDPGTIRSLRWKDLPEPSKRYWLDVAEAAKEFLPGRLSMTYKIDGPPEPLAPGIYTGTIESVEEHRDPQPGDTFANLPQGEAVAQPTSVETSSIAHGQAHLRAIAQLIAQSKQDAVGGATIFVMDQATTNAVLSSISEIDNIFKQG